MSLSIFSVGLSSCSGNRVISEGVVVAIDTERSFRGRSDVGCSITYIFNTPEVLEVASQNKAERIKNSLSRIQFMRWGKRKPAFEKVTQKYLSRSPEYVSIGRDFFRRTKCSSYSIGQKVKVEYNVRTMTRAKLIELERDTTEE